jgi:hypothetical protein
MDNRRVPGPAPGEEPPHDAAVFAPARLQRARPRTGIAIAVAIAVGVGGLAVAGVLGGRAATSTSTARVDRTVVAAAGDGSTREAPWRSHPGTGEPFEAPLLGLHTQISGRLLFVNGDVFTSEADVVVLIVGDRRGNRVELRPVELAGGSTAFRLGANDRFDVTFELADWAAEPAWLWATAYDRAGNALASLRQSLEPAYGHDRVPAT